MKQFSISVVVSVLAIALIVPLIAGDVLLYLERRKGNKTK